MRGDETRVTTHHFNDEQAIVRRCRVANAVNRIKRRVHSRIKADGFIAAKNIIVDRTGNAYDRDLLFFPKSVSSAERAISTNANKSLNTSGFQILRGFFSPFGFHKFGGASCFQNSSAALNDICHIAKLQCLDVVL
ncbi:hypothetical protein D3C87_1618640 [compost metagenome]